MSRRGHGEDDAPTIWTIGHSTRSREDFLSTLASFQIQLLVDVRRYPGSKKFPHFNSSELEKYLPENHIDYFSSPGLGGRRKPHADSKNTIWRNESFRGYADYAETGEFAVHAEHLMDLARQKRCAYMCSEAVWWRCHRAIISDYLKERGWQVMHIIKDGIANEHPYTGGYLEKHKTDIKNAEIHVSNPET